MSVVLRSWRPSDAHALFHAVCSSTDLAAQLGDADLSSIDLCRVFITERLARRTAAARIFAIAVDGRAVGTVAISAMERRHDTGWVSYWLAADARGQGLASRALATASAWGFAENGLYRLELGHRVNNPASCRVATRAGYRAEGIEREKLRYGDERFDVETHARLASDAALNVELFGIEAETHP